MSRCHGLHNVRPPHNLTWPSRMLTSHAFLGQSVRIICALRVDAPHLNAISLADLATAWEAGLVFDLLIFALIVLKSYQTRVVREWSNAVRLANVGLMQILLQDGEC